MFLYGRSLTNLNVSSFDTSNVTNMDNMFGSCGSLTSLDLSNFDTSKVTNMHLMFDGSGSLTSLDLSNFDTTNVTDMERMFYYCWSLKTIYASDKFVISSGTITTNMFGNCNYLTGGAGTTSNSSFTDGTYARIDDPSHDKPGYFTRK